MRFVLCLAITLGCALASWAQEGPKSNARRIEYKQGGQTLEGWLHAPSEAGAGRRRPLVLLAHEAGAGGMPTRQKAQVLAQLGYPVFSVDLYGKGITPKSREDALEKAGLTGPSRSLLRERMKAALSAVETIPEADPATLAAVGYGIGGTAVLELARTKADLKSAICIHGDPTATTGGSGRVGASVLTILGAEDPLATPEKLSAFQAEMAQGKVDWQLILLGGVAGDFSNPQAGKDPKSGRAYDAEADQRATGLVRWFLAESLRPTAAPLAQRGPGPGASKPLDPVKPAPLAKGIPEKAMKVLEYIDANDKPMKGYEGGRNFGNFEKRLPQTEAGGKRIRYREWDVNPLRPGVNRGAERLVTGSDGSAYYTDDHYSTFKKIR